jgi:hypothetical protein
LLRAVTPSQNGDVRTIQQPIEQALGEHGYVGKNCEEFLGFAVCRQDQRGAPVAAFDQPVRVVGLGERVLPRAEVVQGDQVGRQVAV